MEIILGTASVLAGYLAGSFPTAYLVTRILRGVDIRDIDVGNMGAAAVRRQMGLVPGMVVAIIDIAKGSGAVLLAQQISGESFIWIYGAGFAALIGHCFPLYIGFRGGQGTATMIGIFAVLTPLSVLIVLPLMAILLLIFRRIYPMVISIAPALPLVIWFVTDSLTLTIYSLVLIIFMISRNIKGISNEIAKLRRKIHFRR